MVIGENQQQNTNYDPNFLNSQLDADQVADKTAMILRGYRWDPNENKFSNIQTLQALNEENEVVEYKILTEPILSEEGIKEIMAELRPRLQNVFASATITSSDIQSSRKAVAKVLWEKLVINRKKYNLQLEDLKSTLFLVDDQLYFFISRAEKGGFLKSIYRLFTQRENINITRAEKGGYFN